MSLRLQIIVSICMVLAIVYIIYLTRLKKIDFKYSLMWILVCIVVFVMALCPMVLVFITSALGIATPVNMLFFLGFIFSLIIIFNLSIMVSDLLDKVKKLSQELAILRKDALEKKKDE